MRTYSDTTTRFFCFSKFLTGRADSAVEREPEGEGEEGEEPKCIFLLWIFDYPCVILFWFCVFVVYVHVFV